MKRPRFAEILIPAILFVSINQAIGANQRPNVVVIIADDLGWADLGCTGSTFYETPNLDRMAREGALFTQGYAACPVCSPSRAALVTGKYPQRVHITDYIGGRRAGKLNPAPYQDHLDLEEVTVAEAFREAGYATAFFGKWHLGSQGFWPEDQGFDLNLGGNEKGHPPSYFSPYRIPNLTDGPDQEYLTDRLTNEAIGFIESHKDQPFLVWLPHYAVHTPLQSKSDLRARYEEKAARLNHEEAARFRPEGTRQDRRIQDHAVYAGMMASLDESVGRLLETLDRLGLADQTVVVFTSDNGGLSTSEGSPTSNAPFRAGKGWLYEGGIRVPYIVRYPGTIPTGQTLDTPVISMDVYPTLLDLAGLPSRPEQHRDGVSLAALMKTGTPIARDAMAWHYPHYGNQGGRPGGAIREGDWKLIEWYEDGRSELFNLAEDLEERHDRSVEQPEKVLELQRRLEEWRREVGAIMPTPNPEYVPGTAPTVPDQPARKQAG